MQSEQALVTSMRNIWDQADSEGRALTIDERRQVESLIKGVDRIKTAELLDGDSRFTRTLGADSGRAGDRFIKSAEYAKVKDPIARGQTFSTGAIQVSDTPLSAKGTLLETGVGGPGGGLVPPTYEQGVVRTLFQPLGVADLFATSQVTASQVRYVVEGTATSAAAGVLEAGVKPESAIALSEEVEPIRKVATVLPISDELFEDAPSVQTYLNERLGLFVKIEEERQLLRGAGTAELVGVFNRGIGSYPRGTVDNNAVALLKAISGVRGSAFLEPDAIVIHPSNWQTTRLLTDSAGQFLGGGPFQGQYGSGQSVSTSQFSPASLWKLRVVTSTEVGAGTALLGSFGQAAHVWRRGGVTVEASNSHDKYWVQNLISLRAESRLGLGVLRPAGFVEVTGLA